MEINKKTFLILILVALNFVSCQTKKLFFTKYENLSPEKKKEVKIYLKDVEKAYPKQDTEIALMLSYKCFLNQSISINNTIKKDFPELKNESQYGTIFVNVEKNLKIIDFEVSNGLKIKIKPKNGYDYISICYSESSKEWYIEYYDYPHLNFNE